jgi:exopolysaccharide biosynthesis polyprenyl glycosylphosphotransferase
MPFLKRYAGMLTFGLAVADSLVILAAYTGAIYLSLAEADSGFRTLFLESLPYYGVFVLVWCGAATDQRLFQSRREDSLSGQLFSVAKAIGISLVFTWFVVGFFQRKGLQLDRAFFLYFSVGTLGSMIVFRMALRLVLWSLRRRGYNFRQIVIVGANDRSRHLAEIFMTRSRYGYHLLGCLDDDDERMRVFDPLPVRYLGTSSQLESILTREVVDEVYLALPVKSCYEDIRDLANRCESVGVSVRMMTDLFPMRIATSTIVNLEDVSLLSMSAVPEAHMQLGLKRLIDFAGSTIGLLILGPLLFLPIAILIKLESKGPIFFSQERVGLNQRRFPMIKFRSMVANAEAMRAELEAMNEADGPVFKIKRDPRITRLGAFMRKTSIDELPQLFNVWLGQMSLVGPRPPIPAEVEDYTWEQRRRLSVKPGMTGLWQVSGRNDVNFQEWVDMDLAYIDNWSLLQDVRILIKTFNVVIQGRGAS